MGGNRNRALPITETSMHIPMLELNAPSPCRRCGAQSLRVPPGASALSSSADSFPAVGFSEELVPHGA